MLLREFTTEYLYLSCDLCVRSDVLKHTVENFTKDDKDVCLFPTTFLENIYLNSFLSTTTKKIDPLMYTQTHTLLVCTKKVYYMYFHSGGGESKCFGASVAVGSQLYSIFLQTVKAATK